MTAFSLPPLAQAIDASLRAAFAADRRLLAGVQKGLCSPHAILSSVAWLGDLRGWPVKLVRFQAYSDSKAIEPGATDWGLDVAGCIMSWEDPERGICNAPAWWESKESWVAALVVAAEREGGPLPCRKTRRFPSSAIGKGAPDPKRLLLDAFGPRLDEQWAKARADHLEEALPIPAPTNGSPLPRLRL